MGPALPAGFIRDRSGPYNVTFLCRPAATSYARGGICQCKHWRKRLMAAVSHIGEFDAILQPGRMALARNLLPDTLVDGGKARIARRVRVHFRDLETSGAIHPLRVDLAAADHGDFADGAPQ